MFLWLPTCFRERGTSGGLRKSSGFIWTLTAFSPRSSSRRARVCAAGRWWCRRSPSLSIPASLPVRARPSSKASTGQDGLQDGQAQRQHGLAARGHARPAAGVAARGCSRHRRTHGAAAGAGRRPSMVLTASMAAPWSALARGRRPRAARSATPVFRVRKISGEITLSCLA